MDWWITRRKLVPGLIAVVVLAAIGLFIADWPLDWRSWVWNWLGEGGDGTGETNSATLRNFGLIIAGVLALVIAIWRGLAADTQAKATQRQAETAQRQAETAQTLAETARMQAETAQHGLLNERYQRGAEMLGSNDLAVRLGGIYALERLAREHPHEYHVQIMNLFCIFVRNPHADASTPQPPKSKRVTVGDYPESYWPPDREAVMKAIGTRSEEQLDVERRSGHFLDLTDTNLRNLFLMDANLQNIFFHSSDLSGATLAGSKFENSFLSEANISGTAFSFGDPIVSTGVSQETLGEAISAQSTPPEIDDMKDPDTGYALVWNGGKLEDKH